MGDAADDAFDQGLDAWAAHLNGGCDPYCQYCAEEDDDLPSVTCPRCGAEGEDLDGFGFVHCPACDYCTHPSRTGGVCEVCGEVVGR